MSATLRAAAAHAAACVAARSEPDARRHGGGARPCGAAPPAPAASTHLQPGRPAAWRGRCGAVAPRDAPLELAAPRSRDATPCGLPALPLPLLSLPAEEEHSAAAGRAAAPHAAPQHVAAAGAHRRSPAPRPPRLAHASTNLSAPPPTPTGPDNEYYLQCGVAIRTLRDELPAVFDRELSYDIYREDVAFVDRISLPGVPSEAHGLDAYKRVFLSLRLHGALCFSRTRVSLLRIWQPRERTLAVRWSVAATPRLLSSLGLDDMHFDGISEYKLDNRGMIYEHVVCNCDFGTQQPLRSRALAQLLAGLAPAQSPTPSFCRGADVAGGLLLDNGGASSLTLGTLLVEDAAAGLLLPPQHAR